MNYSYLFKFSKCAANLFGKHLHQRFGKSIRGSLYQTVKVAAFAKFSDDEAEAGSVENIFDFDSEVWTAGLLAAYLIL